MRAFHRSVIVLCLAFIPVVARGQAALPIGTGQIAGVVTTPGARAQRVLPGIEIRQEPAALHNPCDAPSCTCSRMNCGARDRSPQTIKADSSSPSCRLDDSRFGW